MLLSTYKHDYTKPNSRRYDFLQLKGQAADTQKETDQCKCVEEIRVEIPKNALAGCTDQVEWTGIAPMGKLENPRLIPVKYTSDQIQNIVTKPEHDCYKDQPNRFLQTLRTAYPDLYERLKQMPKDELNRRIESERLITTYQIDFCNMREYPEGVYENIKKGEETEREMHASKLLKREGACSEFRRAVMKELENAHYLDARQDPCEKAYRPFKISFADSSRFINSGNNSHWRTAIFAKRANFSEYMDTINKNGCIIMKNNIHDHSKCANGKHCRHQLFHLCPNLK